MVNLIKGIWMNYFFYVESWTAYVEKIKQGKILRKDITQKRKEKL